MVEQRKFVSAIQFFLLSSSSVFQIGSVSGWTFNEYQHSRKPDVGGTAQGTSITLQHF